MAQTRKNRRSGGGTRKKSRSGMGTRTTRVVAAPVKTYVKREINRNVETKYVAQQPFNSQSGLLNVTNFTAGITGNNECYALIPPVVQGDGDHNRVGNSIKPVSLHVKGFVSITGNNLSSVFIDVDIWCLTSKTLKSQFQEGSLDMNSLLNVGNGLNASYDGSFYNSVMPINTSLFTVLKHRRIRLMKAYGNGNTAICGGTDETAVYSQERMSALFNFKIPMPAKLKYDLDAQTVPSNYYPFMVIGYNSPSNCDASGIGNTYRIVATAQSQFYFKDA